MAVTVKENPPKWNENPTVEIDSDKFKHKFIVKKSEDGFAFWQVRVTQGQVPAALSAFYTTMEKAVDAVLEYERKAQKSKTVVRDEKFENRGK
jgi:hypothetical protein